MPSAAASATASAASTLRARCGSGPWWQCMSMAPTTSSFASGVTAPANDSAAPVSTAGGGEELREDDVGREHVLRETPCRARGGGVVGLDGAQRIGGLVERGEEAETVRRRQMLLRPRRLDDARTAAREVADRPVAHPAGPRLHVRRLRAAELAARALDVGAERLRRARDHPRLGEPPAVRREQRAV